jgi:TPR repeat protein
MNKQEALSAIRWEVSALAIGLLLGATAFWFIRPKQKARSPLEMARRWLSWGLLAALPTAALFFIRQPGVGGLVGALLGLLFYGGGSWVIGFLWGLVRFGQAGPSASPPATLPSDELARKSSRLLPAGVAAVALVLLGLVGLSALRSNQGAAASSLTALPVEDITAGYLEPGASDIALDRVSRDSAAGLPDAQYLFAMWQLLGSATWLNPDPPSPLRPWGLGLRGEPKILQGSQFELREASSLQPALELLHTAAAQGHALAQVALYECYYAGIGVPKDVTKAWEWLQRAVATGSTEARFRLAFADGQNEEVKFLLLSRLAEAGHPAAQRFLSEMHGMTAFRSAQRMLGGKFGTIEENRFGRNLDILGGPKPHKLPLLTVRYDYNDQEFSDAAAAMEAQHPETAIARKWAVASALSNYPPGLLTAALALMPDPASQQQALRYMEAAAKMGYYPAIMDLISAYKGDEYPFNSASEALTWAYVAQQHPNSPRWPQGSTANDPAGFVKSQQEAFRAFHADIEQIEGRCSPSQRATAQRSADKIAAEMLTHGGPWLDTSRSHYF